MGDELKKELGEEYLKELDRIAFEIRRRMQELKLPEQSNLFNFYNGQLCMIRTAKTKFKHIFKIEEESDENEGGLRFNGEVVVTPPTAGG